MSSQVAVYHKIFHHPLLDDPFNHAVEQRLFDNIPDTIFVNAHLEIKVNLSLINEFKQLNDLTEFLAKRAGQLPSWTLRYENDLRHFQRKMYAINEYLYDVGGMGSLMYVSETYYKVTGRNIRDFVVSSS
ncbi:MAG: hypothetical protein ACOH5I_15600 [Oligoflexus sp.]